MYIIYIYTHASAGRGGSPQNPETLIRIKNPSVSWQTFWSFCCFPQETEKPNFLVFLVGAAIVEICWELSRCVSMCLNINVSLELWSSLQRREFSRSLNCEDEFPSRRLDTSWHVQMPFYLEARKMANTQCLMAGDSVPTASLRRMQLSELVWQILYGEKQLLTNSEVKKEVSIFRYNWYN